MTFFKVWSNVLIWMKCSYLAEGKTQTANLFYTIGFEMIMIMSSFCLIKYYGYKKYFKLIGTKKISLDPEPKTKIDSKNTSFSSTFQQ